jgi:hypothetical protein
MREPADVSRVITKHAAVIFLHATLDALFVMPSD